MFHLFDSAKLVLDSVDSDLATKASTTSESSRLLEDRMMAIEQRHGRLSRSFDQKVAVDSELDDFQENVRNEVFFTISGLPRLPADLSGREWQARASQDVQRIIALVIGRELPIVVIHNVSGRGSQAEVRYHVRLQCAADSVELRSKFGSFFAGGTDSRPSSLQGISIGNKLTPGTQVRLAILKLLAKRYLSRNPGGKSKVIGFESRPMIRLTPPPGAKSKRVLNFNYIEAIRSLPVNFSSEEVSKILKMASTLKFSGKLRSTFVVINDDMLRVRKAAGPGGSGSGSVSAIGQSQVGPSDADEDEAEIEADSEDQVTEVQTGTSVSGMSGSGTNKRGASSPPHRSSKNRR